MKRECFHDVRISARKNLEGSTLSSSPPFDVVFELCGHEGEEEALNLRSVECAAVTPCLN